MNTAKQEIADLLEQAIGLKVKRIGESTFERVVHGRMTALGINDFRSYVKKLHTSPAEFRELVEDVVIPETWFFRDQEPFAALTHHIIEKRKRIGRKTVVFRILSLPCSTGEEPYSIAMALMQAGLAQSQFYIDAVDVSERALVRAQQAVYRKNSFRSKDLAFRDRFFLKTEAGFALKREVCKKVRFLHGNITNSTFMESLGCYDVVFCRNVLIYFNEEAQKRAINALYRLLLPGGFLFTGHAEMSLFFDTPFVSYFHHKAFAFYKKEEASASRGPEWSKKSAEVCNPGGFLPQVKQGAKVVSVPSFSAAAPKEEEGKLVIARRLADEGKLDEAARHCAEHLQTDGPSASGYYLLGVIRGSEGLLEEAMQLLRKAVYLDPEHLDSLIELALLSESAGDVERAENYRRRVKRIQEGG